MRRKDNGGSLRRRTVRTDDIGPVGCIFVKFDKYTYQSHGTIVVQNEIIIIIIIIIMIMTLFHEDNILSYYALI